MAVLLSTSSPSIPPHFVEGKNDQKFTKKSSDTKATDDSDHKTTEIFKDNISEINKKDESDYCIKAIIEQKDVSEEVAQAEYDFFS